MPKVNKEIQNKIITAILCPFTSGCMALIGHELPVDKTTKGLEMFFQFFVLKLYFISLQD